MIYFIIILMTIVGSVASYYLKKTSAETDIKYILLNKYLYVGGGLYFISALMNIYALKYLDYSVVLPLTSITYIWTMMISHYKLNETITKKKLIGISAIFVGAIIVTL